MVMGVSHHTTHIKLTLLIYFNNENDKMTIEKRYYVKRLMAHYSETGYFNSEGFLAAIHKSGIKYLDETSKNYQNELENNDEFIINDEKQFEHTNLFSENQNEIENNDEIQTTTISPSKKESSEARKMI